jgi:membrane associated rhomboid family serine protease
MGSNIENGISTKYMAFLYIISGFGGNLLSSVLNPTSLWSGSLNSSFRACGILLSIHIHSLGFHGIRAAKI